MNSINCHTCYYILYTPVLKNWILRDTTFTDLAYRKITLTSFPDHSFWNHTEILLTGNKQDFPFKPFRKLDVYLTKWSFASNAKLFTHLVLPGSIGIAVSSHLWYQFCDYYHLLQLNKRTLHLHTVNIHVSESHKISFSSQSINRSLVT